MLPNIATEGVLVRRGRLVLGWPVEAELDAMTELRNRPSVRRWFVDDRRLDPARNRVWIATRMDRPREALLAIRRAEDGLFLGTIGWTEWDREQATAVFGRLAVDARRAAAADAKSSVALEATLALRDYAFEVMRLRSLSTAYMSANALCARVNERVGMVPRGRFRAERPGGRTVEMVAMEMDRERWLRLTRAEEHAAG